MKKLKFVLVIIGLSISFKAFNQTNVAAGATCTFTGNITLVSGTSLTDGNTSTKSVTIISDQSSPTITIDLGAYFDLSSITFYWGTTYYATAYSIWTSSDNINYSFKLGVTNNTNPIDSRTFSPTIIGVRWVKISNFAAKSGNNYTTYLNEIEVYGTAGCTYDGNFRKLNTCDVATFNSTSNFTGLSTFSNGVKIGTINYLQSSLAIKSPTLDINTTFVDQNNAERGKIFYNSTNNSFGMYVYGGISIHLKGNNVGIGTGNPAYTLDVYGNFRAQQVFVDLNGVPDYIFDKNYKLRSLKEVESYIKENKHLPDIKSANDIEKGSVSLNEMNIKLLQKVEELTLYIIQQNKRIEALEKASNIQTIK